MNSSAHRPCVNTLTASGQSLAGKTIPPAQAGRIIVVFRNDDPSAIMDLDHERSIFDIFESHGAPQTIGVVPCITLGPPRDPAPCDERILLPGSPAAEFLLQHVARTGAEIALHGLTHRTHPLSRPARRLFFEFGMRDEVEQQAMLARGLDIIEQALKSRPVTFIPPWNRMDEHTLLACDRAGIKSISAGVHTPIPPDCSLRAIGCNASLSNFSDLLFKARRGTGRVIINVLFHSRTITSASERNLLEQAVTHASESDDCCILTVSEVASRFPDLAARYNESGAAVADSAEIWGSARSRAHIYRPILSMAGLDFTLSNAASRARTAYECGDYANAIAATEHVERHSRACLLGMRLSVLLVFLIAGAFLAIAVHASSPWFRAGLPGAAIALIPILTWIAINRLLAPESRREILRASALAVGGIALGFGGAMLLVF